jgi:putative ABC transport system ATP-binding protein
MNSIAIKCRGIKKGYGEKENRIQALNGIDLDVFPRSLTLLVGPSGSGKTTLLSIFATILTPDEGELFLLDYNVTKMSEDQKAQLRRNSMGIVFQSLFLIPTLTVAENVALPLMINGWHRYQAKEKAVDLLKQMKLDSRSNESPALLSKGQQQRVAIARAMINDSKIILCDEPTSSLDHVAGAQVMSFLQELALESSRAVVVVTHDHRIFPFATQIVEMSDGQITNGEEYV